MEISARFVFKGVDVETYGNVTKIEGDRDTPDDWEVEVIGVWAIENDKLNDCEVQVDLSEWLDDFVELVDACITALSEEA